MSAGKPEAEPHVVVLPIAQPLLEWYAKHARPLPWRETKDPYRIWVSEIMLQQTRVEAVKPYYARFIAALPDIPALAHCEENTLLKLWEGLGYYTRARNMQRAARILLFEYGGQFPDTVDTLLRLPGIGAYTAGAIASIAFHIPAPAVDGNVLRVLSRLYNSAWDTKQQSTRRIATEILKNTIPQDNASSFNQALMELGACICTPQPAPLCHSCPILHLCRGYAEGTVPLLPVKSKKAPRRKEQHTVFVLKRQGAALVRKRKDTGLLRGMWELPNLPGHLTEQEMAQQLYAWRIQPIDAIACYTRKHIFTHIEWDMRVYAMEVMPQELATPSDSRLPPVGQPPAEQSLAGQSPFSEGWEWFCEGNTYALPTAFKICLDGMQDGTQSG